MTETWRRQTECFWKTSASEIVAVFLCTLFQNSTTLPNFCFKRHRSWPVLRKYTYQSRNRLLRVMKYYSPTGRRNHGSRPLKRLLDTWDRNGSTNGPIPCKIWWWWSWRRRINIVLTPTIIAKVLRGFPPFHHVNSIKKTAWPPTLGTFQVRQTPSSSDVIRWYCG